MTTHTVTQSLRRVHTLQITSVNINTHKAQNTQQQMFYETELISVRLTSRLYELLHSLGTEPVTVTDSRITLLLFIVSLMVLSAILTYLTNHKPPFRGVSDADEPKIWTGHIQTTRSFKRGRSYAKSWASDDLVSTSSSVYHKYDLVTSISDWEPEIMTSYFNNDLVSQTNNMLAQIMRTVRRKWLNILK